MTAWRRDQFNQFNTSATTGAPSSCCWLQLHATAGEEILYLGCLVRDIEVPGWVIPQRGPQAPLGSPGVSGMNVIREPYCQMLGQHGCDLSALSESHQSEIRGMFPRLQRPCDDNIPFLPHVLIRGRRRRSFRQKISGSCCSGEKEAASNFNTPSRRTSYIHQLYSHHQTDSRTQIKLKAPCDFMKKSDYLIRQTSD